MKSYSLQEMDQIAHKIGENLVSGDVLILSGDLGAGKTTLTKFIATSLGIKKMIKSPTYTIVREYNDGRLPLYHMDVYRIESGAGDLGLEEYFEGDGVSIVEWGQMLGDEKPADYLEILIGTTQDDSQRTLQFIANGKQSEELRQKIGE